MSWNEREYLRRERFKIETGIDPDSCEEAYFSWLEIMDDDSCFDCIAIPVPSREHMAKRMAKRKLQKDSTFRDPMLYVRLLEGMGD